MGTVVQCLDIFNQAKTLHCHKGNILPYPHLSTEEGHSADTGWGKMVRMGDREWLSWIFPDWELEGVATVPSLRATEASFGLSVSLTLEVCTTPHSGGECEA